jgi:triacylglycerol lipase
VVALARHGWLMPQLGRRLQTHGESSQLVVFVHGFFASTGVFKPLAEHLTASKIALRQLHFNYTPTGNVAERAEQLSERIAEVHPEGQVHIVAHSLGGLIARYYAQVLGHRLDSLVSIGTPHEGTSLARGWPLQLARELSPGSSLLKTLDATRKRLEDTRLTSVVAVQDSLVPVRSAALPGSRVVYIDGVGHHGVLFHKDMWNVVCETLSASGPSSSTNSNRTDESGEHPKGNTTLRRFG